MQNRERTVVRYAISAVALVLLVGHLLFPDKKLDAVALGLVVVGVIPWLGSVFKSLKLPGGLEVEYLQLVEASVALAVEQQRRRQTEAVVPAAAAAPVPAPPAPASPAPRPGVVPAIPTALSYSLSGVKDPRLRLLALRAEIEKRLRDLALQWNVAQLGLGAHLGPAALLGALTEARVLTPALHNSLQVAIQAGNKALHGAEVSDLVGDWAAESGPVLLRYLEERMLNYAHVRVIPTPEFIDRAGVRRPMPQDGICLMKPFNPNAPNDVSLNVSLDGTYEINIPRSRVQLEELDETSHGFHVRAELRLAGLKIVIDPHKTQPERGVMIWTEPA